jgi:RNA polymerase sigma-70 factor, ECF subfamily
MIVTGHDQLSNELLRRAQCGDADALGQLLEYQRAELRQHADRLLDARIRARVDASDLVQQTCLSVHKQIRDFAGSDPAQFVAWVRQIHEHNVQNAIREHLHADRRAAGRDRSLREVDVADAEAATPSQRLTREEDSRRLREILDRLPPREREALRLRYVEGRSLAESADAMQITRDALLWLLKRGLQHARRESKSIP